MSKNKEKHNIHESADGGRQPAHRPVHHSFSDGGGPLGEGGTTDDGRQTGEDGRRQTEDGPVRNATHNIAGGRQPASPAPAGPADQVKELTQLQDRFLRLQADFDNFRKRTLREKNELFDSANQALILELLPVLDHLQLGIQAASAHQADPAFREGLAMIFDQLMVVLIKFGLSPIETENQVFDPNRFEAVNALPSATEPEGTVLDLVRRGYMLRNKLLRPAQVIVSSGPPPEENAECKMQNEE